jgi:predicted branched-subunit amino acid permease
VTLQKHPQTGKRKNVLMKALILNSGMGTRMGVLTAEHPKCMTEIAGEETILSAQLKKALAFGVTDESFAIFTTEKEENCTPWFFFGLILSTYLSWNAGTLIGAFVSDLLPAMLSASLGISLYAMFIGLLVPHLRGNLRLTLLVVLTAACSYLLSLVMDGSWAMILSTLFGAAVGVFFVDLGEKKEDAYES